MVLGLIFAFFQQGRKMSRNNSLFLDLNHKQCLKGHIDYLPTHFRVIHGFDGLLICNVLVLKGLTIRKKSNLNCPKIHIILLCFIVYQHLECVSGQVIISRVKSTFRNFPNRVRWTRFLSCLETASSWNWPNESRDCCMLCGVLCFALLWKMFSLSQNTTMV